ncbi:MULTISPECIES: CHAP domain-containing protein [unclassified Granulicatella]|uniref:CHAP domain-containing protein n=1 Tax=unclassified Granulicatella TaxID=2630493 RepID=UPI00107377FA|nr:MULTISPECIES: CHAP domain-containing protein [unclassified Granulicatella]MBF0780839.1 CHAP domain-containing protein [Granulicatella sp. 19428wC4_WM01]TFU93525.1 CHAP domain-containing protein [Granulicatella sp. WM01]
MRKRTMLCCSVLVLTSVLATPTITFAEDYASQIQEKSRAIEQHQQQIESNNQLLESLNAQKEENTGNLTSLISEMEKTEKEVAHLQQTIQQTQEDISKLEDEISYLKDAIAKRAVKIEAQVRYMQTDSPGDSFLEAIWTSESIVEAFEKMFAMAELTSASQTTLKQQKEDKEAVERKHQELNTQLASQGQRASELQQLVLEQANRRTQLETTIANLQSQSETANSQNAELQAQVAKAQELITTYKQQEEERRQAEQQSAIAARLSQENNHVASTLVRTEPSAAVVNTTQVSPVDNTSVEVPIVQSAGYISGGGHYASPSPSYIAAVNGGVPGQCTWYVYNRVAQLGAPIPYRKMGNGGEWGTYARSYGYTVTNTPQAGTIVSFTSSVPGMSYYGHVAFVESVNPDGSIVVSEMNVQGAFVISTRTIPASTAALGQYIHVGL